MIVVSDTSPISALLQVGKSGMPGLTTGILGVALPARRRGILGGTAADFFELRTKAGFRISKDLEAHVLQSAGEYPQ